MGFDLQRGEENHDNQMSLFELSSMNFTEGSASQTQTSQRDSLSSEGSTALDYNAWKLAHMEPEQSKTSKFMTLSMALHAAAILAIAMMTVPLVEKAKTETITIEIEEAPAPRLQARGAKVPATQGGTPAMELPAKTSSLPPQAAPSRASDSGGPGDVVVASKPASAKTAKAAKAATTKAAKSAKASSVAQTKAGRSIAPKTNFKAVPMTIDDIEAPELDQGALTKVNVKSNMNEDFNEDFDNIDRSHKKSLSEEKSKMDAMAAALAAEQDDALNALDEQNKEDAARLAALQKSLRKNNAKAIASAIAGERASAAAARAAAEREAAAQAAAANAKKSGLGGSGNGLGQGQGAGAGNNGSSMAGTQLAGAPSGVRSLDQLRQMPGNPRPQYDREERRRGDQGAVAFVAYVNKEGYVSKFRMLKSTGYRNLDAKTLNALKKWRFFPGQEGWVELPFRWDIKGGVQEDGGRLRTSVSQR